SDPPIDLRDREDHAWQRDRFEAMEVGAEGRVALRAALAGATAARLEARLDAGALALAADDLLALLTLWRHDPGAAGPELAPLVPLLGRAATLFGRHGVDQAALAAHAALARSDAGRAAHHAAEVATILAYLEDLGRAGGEAAAGQLAV